jgi:hypothetical protein
MIGVSPVDHYNFVLPGLRFNLIVRDKQMPENRITTSTYAAGFAQVKPQPPSYTAGFAS